MSARLLHGSVLITYHHKLMPFAWSIFIDAAIFAAIFSHKPYFLSLHAIGAFLVGGASIVTSFQSFLKGIPTEPGTMRNHKMVGVTLYVLITLQVCIGILWWLIRSSQKHSKISILVKKIHKILGYSLALLSKIQVLYILDSSKATFWFNLLWDILSILLVIYLKKTEKAAQSHPEVSFKNASFRCIKRITEISQNYARTFTYGNYIFDCESMRSSHPAGFQIILQQRNQCMDRYLYGMMGPQALPQVPLHTHSAKSLKLLSNPIAKLDVAQQFKNFDQQSFSVQIHEVNPICTQGGVYAVKLKVLQGQFLQYEGYSTLEQLGRYYSLTLNDKISRLYTTVNFLLPQNLRFIQKIFPKITFNNNVGRDVQQMGSSEQVGIQSIPSRQTIIPLIIKKYNNGRFTKNLLQSQSKKLTLSCSKGRGLQLWDVGQGTIMIVAGGTGLLPFCDLIDLLFKQELISNQPQYRQQILSRNPIIRTNFLSRNNFHFLIAANYAGEIHPIIFEELRCLSLKPQKYRISLKIKHESNIEASKMKIENSSFQEIINQSIHNEQLGKIIVCGPQKMNRAMLNLFRREDFHKYLIL